jgi:signal transduction histidine kinase
LDGLANLAERSQNLEEVKALFKLTSGVTNELWSMLVKLKVLSVQEYLDEDKEVLNPDEILATSISKLQVQINGKKLQLTINTENKGNARGFPYAIESILDNLLENSVNFCNTGDEIEVKLLVTDSQIEIIVNDSGPGIPGKFHSVIWKMYQRANENAKGNGLGLYVVKRLSDQLNGAIDFTSEPGKGTKITVLLPLA